VLLSHARSSFAQPKSNCLLLIKKILPKIIAKQLAFFTQNYDSLYINFQEKLGLFAENFYFNIDPCDGKKFIQFV
jgi:hypothetical protein